MKAICDSWDENSVELFCNGLEELFNKLDKEYDGFISTGYSFYAVKSIRDFLGTNDLQEFYYYYH